VKLIVFAKGMNNSVSDFILIPKKNLELTETKYFAFVKKDALEKEEERIKGSRKDRDYLKHILDEYKRQRD